MTEVIGITEEEIIVRIMELARADRGLANLSVKHGFDPSYLTQIVHGHKKVSRTVANTLGYERVVIYVPYDKQQLPGR